MQDTEKREPIIQVKDLRLAYGDKLIMEHVTFDVYEGEVVVLCGGSGSGKSTLLKNMISLNRPPEGQVLIEGEDIVVAEGKTLERILRRFGVMYQMGALFGSMTLLENVRLPLEARTQRQLAVLWRTAQQSDEICRQQRLAFGREDQQLLAGKLVDGRAGLCAVGADLAARQIGHAAHSETADQLQVFRSRAVRRRRRAVGAEHPPRAKSEDRQQ